MHISVLFISFFYAHFCIMYVLYGAICVCTADPGDPGAMVKSVGREREG